MAVNKGKRPVTDEDREAVRRLAAQGLGRNAIARELRRSPRTISVIAEQLDPPVLFDRTMTAVATEARVIDAKARRTAIIDGLYAVAEDDLAYLRGTREYALVEVSMGAPVRYTAQRLPAQDRKALVGAIGSAVASATKLEALDTANGVNDAKSMIGDLAAGLTAAYQAMNEGAGDAP